jgi:hypothetical protein
MAVYHPEQEHRDPFLAFISGEGVPRPFPIDAIIEGFGRSKQQ